MSDLFIGVQTTDLPTLLTTGGVSAASINTAAIEGYFERGATDGVYTISDPVELERRLGKHKSYYYGRYVADSFFANLQGETGFLYVQRLKRTGSTSASATVNDTQTPTPLTFATFAAGQLGRHDVGAWGNELGVKVIQSTGTYATTISVATTALDTVISVTAIGNDPAGILLNDWVVINGTINKKVVARDEIAGTITLDSAIGAIVAVNATVVVKSFTVTVHRRSSSTGIVDDLETFANLSFEPAHVRYFPAIISSRQIGVGSDYIVVNDDIVGSSRTIGNFPVTSNNIIYLTGGTEGANLSESDINTQRTFWRDARPMYLANAEHFTETMWDNGENYCYNNGRGDITWVGSPTMNMAYGDALLWANKRAKSRKVAALTNLNWITVDDPIATGIVRTKNIPNVGAIMGYWVFITSVRGIHKVPASKQQVLNGIRDVVGEIISRSQLRDLANAGMNAISNLAGVFAVRSARTLSKLPEYRFANALAMTTFFKRSFEESLQELENETSTAALFQRVSKQMYDFSQGLYISSTNGGNESAFASYIKTDGSTSGFQDVVKIVVDESINTRERVLDGELRASFYFMPPTPAERILIGVGLIYSVV